MKKERAKGFVAGLLVSVMALGLIGTAAATIGKRTVEVDYTDIKIELNGEKVTPVDANGNVVEPFAINGTTYLPVRAVSNALGLNVGWDGATSTVKLTGTAGGTEENKTLSGHLLRTVDIYRKIGNIAQDGSDIAGFALTEVTNEVNDGTGKVETLYQWKEGVASLKDEVESLKRQTDVLGENARVAVRLADANGYLASLTKAINDLERAENYAIDFLTYGMGDNEDFYGFINAYDSAEAAFNDLKYDSRESYDDVWPDAYNAAYGYFQYID